MHYIFCRRFVEKNILLKNPHVFYFIQNQQECSTNLEILYFTMLSFIDTQALLTLKKIKTL